MKKLLLATLAIVALSSIYEFKCEAKALFFLPFRFEYNQDKTNDHAVKTLVYNSPFTGKRYNVDYRSNWNYQPPPPVMMTFPPVHWNFNSNWNFNHGSTGNQANHHTTTKTTIPPPTTNSGGYAKKWNWDFNWNFNHGSGSMGEAAYNNNKEEAPVKTTQATTTTTKTTTTEKTTDANSDSNSNSFYGHKRVDINWSFGHGSANSATSSQPSINLEPPSKPTSSNGNSQKQDNDDDDFDDDDDNNKNESVNHTDNTEN